MRQLFKSGPFDLIFTPNKVRAIINKTIQTKQGRISVRTCIKQKIPGGNILTLSEIRFNNQLFISSQVNVSPETGTSTILAKFGSTLTSGARNVFLHVSSANPGRQGVVTGKINGKLIKPWALVSKGLEGKYSTGCLKFVNGTRPRMRVNRKIARPLEILSKTLKKDFIIFSNKIKVLPVPCWLEILAAYIIFLACLDSCSAFILDEALFIVCLLICYVNYTLGIAKHFGK
ncbi:hypothetical protein [Cohnella sp.]|uniref:hypothetical protein n=1 Tax=Cohnella sp. TaxID=1883426 RepID=UPI00356495CD